MLIDEHQVDVPALYFKQQSHSDLPYFAETMRQVRRSGRAQLMQVMTFAPLFMGAASALESQGTWDNISLCVLHDLSSERDLQDHVDRFFETASAGSLLLIQCDPRAASFRRIEHARYICEKGLNDYKRLKGDGLATDAEPEPELEPEPEPEPAAGGKDDQQSAAMGKSEKPTLSTTRVAEKEEAPKGVDVLFLCHLPRGKGTPFSVDFGVEWTYAFVDSIMPASTRGLLGVEAMMQRSLAEMVEMVDLGTVLANNFRLSISRLIFLYQRSNDEVRQQVADILSCLKNESFVSLVRRCMLEMIRHNELALDISTLTSRSATVVGTFMEALHRQFTEVLSAMFAIVLSHMDRNGGLPLFLNSELRSLWGHLFTKSFKEMNVVSLRPISMKQLLVRLEVPTDGKEKVPFASQFPFSGFLNSRLQGLRETVSAIGATNQSSDTETISVSQFKLLQVGHGVEAALDDGLLRQYAHDFACMHLIDSKSMTRLEQAEFLCRVLELHKPGERLATLAAVHGRYWDCESRITLHLQLLDAVPSAAAAVLDLMQMSGEEFLSKTEIPDLAVAIDAAILECALQHLDPSSPFQQWDASEDYGAWLVQVDGAKPAVLSLLSEQQEYVVLTQCRRRWEQFTLIQQFTIDIIVPLSILPATSKVWVAGLLHDELRCHTVVMALVRILCIDIPSLLSVDPNWENDPKESVTQTWRRGAAALMESFIFDVACSVAFPLCDSGLASDLLLLVAGQDLDGLEGVSASYFLLLPSEAGRVALMQKLLHIHNPDLQESIGSQLRKLADDAVGCKESGCLDKPFCQTWLTVIEADIRIEAPDVLTMATTIQLEHLSPSSPSVYDLLSAVARVRIVLLEYAQGISVVIDCSDVPPAAIETMHTLKKVVDPLLAPSASGVCTCLRSMRLHLLKAMERLRGASFVRSAMQQPPLHDSDWLQDWLEENEGGLVRFMGQNKLPQNNPLATEPLFAEASHALAVVLNTGNLGELTTFVQMHATNTNLKSALCATLFHEVGLLEVLPDALSGETADRVHVLRKWIADTDGPLTNVCSPVERKLLQFCAGGLTVDSTGKPNPLALSLSSTPEQIVTVRMLAHLAARVVAAQPNKQFAFFRTLLLDPAAVKDQYFPTMPDDVMSMVQRALMDAGAERGAKRWFTCPNGHPFAIGQCGGAMQVATCPECGEEIGGNDHNLVVRVPQ